MFTKWKNLDRELHELENFSWGTLLHFMSTKWKKLTGELMKLNVHEVENFGCGTLLYFMSKKGRCLARKINKIFFQRIGKRLTGKFAHISCP